MASRAMTERRGRRPALAKAGIVVVDEQGSS